MGVRETINEHPAGIVGAIGGLAVVVFAMVAFQSHQPSLPSQPKTAYFSDDDGKTYFEDDIANVAPFNHSGKAAVSAHVFKCADGKLFVGYLEQAISQEARAVIEQARKEQMAIMTKQSLPVPDSELVDQIRKSSEVKRPGDKEWIAAGDPKATATYKVTCPDGGTPTEVTP